MIFFLILWPVSFAHKTLLISTDQKKVASEKVKTVSVEGVFRCISDLMCPHQASQGEWRWDLLIYFTQQVGISYFNCFRKVPNDWTVTKSRHIKCLTGEFFSFHTLTLWSISQWISEFIVSVIHSNKLYIVIIKFLFPNKSNSLRIKLFYLSHMKHGVYAVSFDHKVK